ncbi:hypothetical protein [Prochlorococcus sp. MIT 1223]|uniref:hypothetical protein n=1 Tax=Prochlorococcus sp. MIT 1223 TaxID=3096217 RepID=UPI002A74A33F|nr:hypothetical protein [Prochlorococcus sp. MIT 1223]
MEFGFKEVLFGLAGVSMIAWAAVIGLWHTYMFPRFFSEDSSRNQSVSDSSIAPLSIANANGSNLGKGELRPSTQTIGLPSRNKYSRQSIVLADFSPVEPGYGVNRLYTIILLGLGITSFVLITFGLQSGFNLI